MQNSKPRKKRKDKFFEELDHWLDNDLKDYQLEKHEEDTDDYRWKDE